MEQRCENRQRESLPELLGGVFEVVPPAEVDTDVLAEQNSTVGEVVHHLNTYENEEVVDLTNYI